MLCLSDFDYHLPKQLIAQSPATPRDSNRLKERQKIVFTEKLSARVVNGELKFNVDNAELMSRLQKIGHTPLPPYIEAPRGVDSEKKTRRRYHDVDFVVLVQTYDRRGGQGLGGVGGLDHDAEVVDGGQAVEQKFAGFAEMMEIGPGVGFAGITITAIIDGILI